MSTPYVVYLGYCYYHSNDFLSASHSYEQLIVLYPDVEEYKLYYSQSLFKAGLYPEASKAAVRVQAEQFVQRKEILQSIIKYEQDDLTASKQFLDNCHDDDPDVIINYAAIAFKEGNYESARTQYTEAINSSGYQADLAYNTALCYYKEQQYGPALRTIAEIIDKGIRNHPVRTVTCTHTLIHSYTHTLTHSHTHTLTHSQTHTLIHSLMVHSFIFLFIGLIYVAHGCPSLTTLILTNCKNLEFNGVSAISKHCPRLTNLACCIDVTDEALV